MVIRAHMPESQSVWTLPTKSIKNSLGPILEEEWKSETYREKRQEHDNLSHEERLKGKVLTALIFSYSK